MTGFLLGVVGGTGAALVVNALNVWLTPWLKTKRASRRQARKRRQIRANTR